MVETKTGGGINVHSSISSLEPSGQSFGKQWRGFLVPAEGEQMGHLMANSFLQIWKIIRDKNGIEGLNSTTPHLPFEGTLNLFPGIEKINDRAATKREIKPKGKIINHTFNLFEQKVNVDLLFEGWIKVQNNVSIGNCLKMPNRSADAPEPTEFPKPDQGKNDKDMNWMVGGGVRNIECYPLGKEATNNQVGN